MDKKKIEEAKERLKIDIADEKMLGTDVSIAYKDDIETLLQYIDELEKENTLQMEMLKELKEMYKFQQKQIETSLEVENEILERIKEKI